MAKAKEKIPGGYYIKARCIQESRIARATPVVREIWDWLLMQVNHKLQQVKGKVIARGQCLRSYGDIREGLRWKSGYRTDRYTPDQIKKAMRWLKRAGMITTRKAGRGVFITICNYSYYQDPSNYETKVPKSGATGAPTGAPTRALRTTPREHHAQQMGKAPREHHAQPHGSTNGSTNGGTTKNKNVKNVKKERDILSLSRSVVDHWNTHTDPSQPYGLSPVLSVTRERAARLENRLAERLFAERWKEAIDIMAESDLFNGRGDRGWRASIDWLIANSTNYVKVLEGTYSSGKAKGGADGKDREGDRHPDFKNVGYVQVRPDDL